MHLSSILLAFAAGAVLTIAHPAIISQELSCSTESGIGQCKNTASGCSDGAFIVDACPGDSTVQCCVKHKASSPSPSHSQKPLKPTKTHSSTKTHSHTPKTSHVKHPKKSPSRTASHSPSPTSSNLAAVDISTANSSTFWSCLAKSKQKVVIRGYQQACGVVSLVHSDLFVRRLKEHREVRSTRTLSNRITLLKLVESAKSMPIYFPVSCCQIGL